MYKNRKEAGSLLAKEIENRGYEAPIIFGLARGGIPVASEIAKLLNATLEVIVVQKLSDIAFPELGFGAIAPAGVLVIDDTIVDEIGIDHKEIQNVKRGAEIELLRRINKYEAKLDLGNLSANTAILVDDGTATGISAKAASRYLRKFNPRKIVLALPVCPSQIMKVLEKDFDEVICLHEEVFFIGVGQFYNDFLQVTDEEVIKLLKNS